MPAGAAPPCTRDAHLCNSPAKGGLHHRSGRHPDLLIAAAEAAGIPVVHYDEDYDPSAAITGQHVRWLAPRGSLR